MQDSTQGGTLKACADGGPHAEGASAAAKSAQILNFPRDLKPLGEFRPQLLPPRSRAGLDRIKAELGRLRGVLSTQQLARLERHHQVLEDYTHLLRVYLSPHEAIRGFESLSPEEQEARMTAVQKAALAILLPTERDTLAGALKTLTSSLSTTIQLQRVVAGLANKVIKGADWDEEGTGEGGVEGLDTDALRKVRDAMALLTGQRQRVIEPPKPPPPEPDR